MLQTVLGFALNSEYSRYERERDALLRVAARFKSFLRRIVTSTGVTGIPRSRGKIEERARSRGEKREAKVDARAIESKFAFSLECL